MAPRNPGHFLTKNERNMWLTLVANADASGRVNRYSLTMLMDYVGCTTSAEVREIINNLEKYQYIHSVQTSTKRPQIQLLADFARDKNIALRYITENLERVTTLQNERSGSYAKQKSLREQEPILSDMSIENIVRVEGKKPTSPKRWQFTLRIPGLGIFHNCAYVLFDKFEPLICGPRTRRDGEWCDLIEFEKSIQSTIRILVENSLPKES